MMNRKISKALQNLPQYLTRARILADGVLEDWDEWNDLETVESNRVTLEMEWLNDSSIFDTLESIYRDGKMTPAQAKDYESILTILHKHKPLLKKMELYVPRMVAKAKLAKTKKNSVV